VLAVIVCSVYIPASLYVPAPVPFVAVFEIDAAFFDRVLPLACFSSSHTRSMVDVVREDGGWDENDAGNADNNFMIGTFYVTRGFVIYCFNLPHPVSTE